MENKVVPLRDRVLILVDQNPEKSEGGIFFPEQYIDPKMTRPMIGKVVAIGEGKVHPTGHFVPTSLKPGEKVIFDKNRVTSAEEFGKGLIFVQESDILCTLEDN